MNEEECLEMPDGTKTEGETVVLNSEVSVDKDSETISISEKEKSASGVEKANKVGKGIGREIFSWAVKIFIGLGLCAITWKCLLSYGFTWRTILPGVITLIYLYFCFGIDILDLLY